jgi:hypothetical protein
MGVTSTRKLRKASRGASEGYCSVRQGERSFQVCICCKAHAVVLSV